MSATKSPDGMSESHAQHSAVRRGRLSLSDLPIKRRLPLLTALLLFGVISAATLLSYLGMRASALELGRERLLSLTEQLAGQLQQPSAIILGKTSAAANNPAVRAFIKFPSTAARAGAVAALQQFAPEQDPNSMQVELWNADRSLALTLPEDSKPEPADLDAEFKQCAADPFKAVGAIHQVRDASAIPVVAALMDDAGKPVGGLVRWRRASLSPNARKQLSDILGSQATVYYGQGEVFTDLEKIVPRPPVSLSSTEVARYTRDGNSFMALARPVVGTPWFVVVEFPERAFLAQTDQFLRRILVIDLILLLAGVAGAFAMSRSITRPLRSLTEAASGIRGGDYSQTVDIRRRDELGALATAFNSMVVKVRDSRRELERKVQERTLQLEAAPNAMLIVDERGRVTLANAQAERLFGYDRAELLEQPVENLIPERYRGAHPVLRADFFGHPASRPMGAGRDLYGLRKDGSEVPIEIGLNPVRIDESTFVLASVIDITERKRAEEALRESQARLVGIVDSAMDAIITVDEEQRVLFFNRAAEKMFRCSAAEAIGQTLERFIPKRFRPTHSSHIQSFGQTGVTTRAMAGARSVYGLRADGEEFPIEASISQVEAGGQKLYTVIMRDITERERAERQFRQVIEGAPNGMVMVDRRGEIVLVNAQVERSFGYSRDELLGQSIEMLVPKRFRAHHSAFRAGFGA